MKMPVSFMFRVAAIPAAMFLSSCVAMQEQREAMQEQREDVIIVQDDMRRLRGRLDALEQEVERLTQQMAATGNEQNRAVQSQMQGMNSSLDDLQRRLRALEASRESDRKEIVETISKRVADIVNKQQPRRSSTPAPRKSASNEGYEHEVQAGETLNAIAKAYGARADEIMEANGLASADKLRVGQKLFIPAP